MKGGQIREGTQKGNGGNRFMMKFPRRGIQGGGGILPADTRTKQTDRVLVRCSIKKKKNS